MRLLPPIYALIVTGSTLLAAAPQLRLTSGTLPIQGGTLFYEAAGAGQALVFIHGGFGDRRMWDDQIKVFADQFRVVRYDHRGFGKSSAPTAAYSPVEDLVRLLDGLHIDRAHLVGNSMGGALAIDFALLHPDRVRTLVLVASGPNGFPVPQTDLDKILAVFATAERQGPAAAADVWLKHPMVAVTMATPPAGDRLRAMVTENRAVFLMRFWPEESLDPPAASRLEEIDIPTLVIVGNQDTPLVRSLAEATASRIAGAELVVIAGADHLPQMVTPVEFNRTVRQFLERH